MKPSSWDKQLGLASPRESAASQSDQTNNPSKNEVRNEVGLDVSHYAPHLSEGRGEAFFLDIPFHRMSVMAINDVYQSLCFSSPRLTGFLSVGIMWDGSASHRREAGKEAV